VFESKSPSVLDQLRAGYVKSLPDKLKIIATAVAARDFTTIIRLGHQLKGSGLSYGFPEISEFGVRLEEAAENRRIPVLQMLVIEFENLTGPLTEHPSHSEKM
jgi:HPt (histidine-containing phosphotransfer) domain-containing protein